MNTSKGAIFAVIGGAVVVALILIGFIVFVLPQREPQGEPGQPTAPSATHPSETALPVPSETSGEGSTPSPEPSETSTAPPPVSDNASVVIVIADWNPNDKVIEVSGYVSGLIEDGGTCTLSVTGPTTATATRAAVADVSTTSCGTLTIPASKVKDGTYSVTLGYKSATSRGTSEPMGVVVQK
jgi:hypothetical protein